MWLSFVVVLLCMTWQIFFYVYRVECFEKGEVGFASGLRLCDVGY
jgi:hypothetical protein